MSFGSAGKTAKNVVAAKTVMMMIFSLFFNSAMFCQKPERNPLACANFWFATLFSTKCRMDKIEKIGIMIDAVFRPSFQALVLLR